MFVSIEGIDGAGKTTISQVIADKLKFKYSGQKALGNYFNIDEQTYLQYCKAYKTNVENDSISIFMLYALSCYLSANNKDNIVCDRHLPTVFFWYGSNYCFDIAGFIYSISKKPDITFVIDVNESVALSRIEEKKNKGTISGEEYLIDIRKAKQAQSFLSKVVPYLEHFQLKYQIINGNRPLEEIVDEILEHIRQFN